MVSNKKFIFNYTATFWAIIANYIFIPLYLYYLGTEWYGVLSIGAIIQSVLVLSDSGITTTLKREFAASEDEQYKKRLLFSFEKLAFGIFSITGVIAAIVLYYLTDDWLQISEENISKASLALQLFILVIITQVLFFFYIGGLWGEDEQEKSSILKILFSLFRNGMVILVLMYDNSIISFILWQIGVSVIFIFIARKLLINIISKTSFRLKWTQVFDKAVIGHNLKFTGGMFFISVISVINYQTDKIILSSMLPIELFGYYTIGFFLSQVVVSGTSPIGHSIFPQLTTAIQNQDQEKVIKLSLEGFTMITILAFAIALVIFFNPQKIIQLWTGNSDAAFSVKEVVPFLVLGSFLQAYQFLPYHLTVAYKNPKPIIIISIINIAITMPLYYFMIKEFGLIGAGYTWLLYNLLSTPLFYIFVIKKYLGMGFIRSTLWILIKSALVLFSIYFLLQIISRYAINLNSNLIGIGTQIAILIIIAGSIFLKERTQKIYSLITSKF